MQASSRGIRDPLHIVSSTARLNKALSARPKIPRVAIVQLRNRHATTHRLGVRNGPHASGRRRIAVLSGSEMCGTQAPTAQPDAARARRPAVVRPARNVPNRARNDQRAIVDDVALSSISVSSSDNRRARQARLPQRPWFNPPQPAARIAAEGGRLVTKGAQPMAGKEADRAGASPSGAVLDDDE
jgi:hypothetical protein